MRRPVVTTTILMLGLWSLRGAPTAIAQTTQPAQAPERTVKRSAIEGRSFIGENVVLSEVVEETVSRDATSRRTRSEFAADADGHPRLVSVTEEERVAQPEGGYQITREFKEMDIEHRARTTRRERERMTARGNGVFVTETEIAEPTVNEGVFLPIERVEQQERRAGDQVVERKATTSVDPSGRGAWTVAEQRVMTRSAADGRAEEVELVYRPDPSGRLAPSERVVTKEWTSGAQAIRSEEIYRPDINSGGSMSRQPVQHLETVRTTLPTGGSDTTRTVSERVGNGVQVIERTIERARPDGRGGLVIDEEVQRSIVNGSLQTVSTGRRTESQR